MAIAVGLIVVAFAVSFLVMAVGVVVFTTNILLLLMFVAMGLVLLRVSIGALWNNLEFVDLLGWAFNGAPPYAQSTVWMTIIYVGGGLAALAFGGYMSIEGSHLLLAHMGDYARHGHELVSGFLYLQLATASLVFGARAIYARVRSRRDLQPTAAVRSSSAAHPLCVAHVSDLHLIARGCPKTLEGESSTNTNFQRIIDRLCEIAAEIDVLLLTGDVTDSGLRDEWQVFVEGFAQLPQELRDRTVLVPGNHDINVVGRSKFWSVEPDDGSLRRARVTRMAAVMDHVHRERAHRCVDGKPVPVSKWLWDTCERERQLSAKSWSSMFPLFVDVTVRSGDTVRVVVLDSNRPSNWLFSNAFGAIDSYALARLKTAMARDEWYERRTIYALHHHVQWPNERLKTVERAKHAFMTLENTDALWTVLCAESEPVVLHGHRHVDRCELQTDIKARVIGAPSSTLGDVLVPRETRTAGFYLLDIPLTGEIGTAHRRWVVAARIDESNEASTGVV